MNHINHGRRKWLSLGGIVLGATLLPNTVLAILLRIFEVAKEVGPNLGRPHSAPLGNGLFEFRTKGKGSIARSVFVNVINREIVILHTLIKKSDAIPKKDMKIIMQRAKEIK